MRYTNCIVPDSGHRNTDNYIRVLDKPRSEGGRLVMLHRLEWEKVNGSIPNNYELNHKCKNRECSNLNHLEVIHKSEHKTKDNKQRYLKREYTVVRYLLDNPEKSQTQVAKVFGLTQPCISRIWRKYKYGS